MLKKAPRSIDPPKALFFDMDGILVDSEALHWESVHRVLRNYLGSQAPQLEQRVGWGDLELWEELISYYDLPKDPITLTQERGQIALDLLREKPPPLMPSALKAICAWHTHPQRPIMAVVSASPKAHMVQSLKDYIDPQGQSIFDGLFSGIDDSDQNKPCPQPYLTAMKYFSVLPNESWVAEDSTTGLTAALNSQANVFAVAAHTAQQKLIARTQAEFPTILALFDFWLKIIE